MNPINRLRHIKLFLCRYKFNYYKTLIVNFRLLPFKQAIYLPFVIYHRTDLKLSRSKIILHCKPKFCLMAWGRNDDLFYPDSAVSMLTMINGTLHLYGNNRVSPGTVFRIVDGNVYIGNQTVFGGGCKVLSNNKISIGSDNQIAFNTVFCDTNFHYVNDNGKVVNRNGFVRVGNNVWIANSCHIIKGAVIPNNCIVSNKSLVNKDFSSEGLSLLLAGTPAKVLKSGVKEVQLVEMERKLHDFFQINPSGIYTLSQEEISRS